jgi:ketosteroid isomerase-like protein
MSEQEENLSIVLGTVDAYLRGDEEVWLATFAPDIVATQFPDQLDSRDYIGLDGVREMMASWLGTWEEWSIAPLGSSAAGEHVFVNAVQRGRGKGSGVPIETTLTFVFSLRDGLIVRWQMFHDEAEARAAVGAA